MSRKTRLTDIEQHLKGHLPAYPQDAKQIIEMVLDNSKMSYNESCKCLSDLIKKFKKDNTQEIKIN